MKEYRKPRTIEEADSQIKEIGKDFGCEHILTEWWLGWLDSHLKEHHASYDAVVRERDEAKRELEIQISNYEAFLEEEREKSDQLREALERANAVIRNCYPPSDEAEKQFLKTDRDQLRKQLTEAEALLAKSSSTRAKEAFAERDRWRDMAKRARWMLKKMGLGAPMVDTWLKEFEEMGE